CALPISSAPESVGQRSAQRDREDVLVLYRDQRAVGSRPDLQRPTRAASLLADLEQHVGDADQVSVLVDEDAGARVVPAELADIELAAVEQLQRVLAEIGFDDLELFRRIARPRGAAVGLGGSVGVNEKGGRACQREDSEDRAPAGGGSSATHRGLPVVKER